MMLSQDETARVPPGTWLPSINLQSTTPPSDRRIPNSQPNQTWSTPNGPVYTGRYAARQTNGHLQIRGHHHSGYHELRCININSRRSFYRVKISCQKPAIGHVDWACLSRWYVKAGHQRDVAADFKDVPGTIRHDKRSVEDIIENLSR